MIKDLHSDLPNNFTLLSVYYMQICIIVLLLAKITDEGRFIVVDLMRPKNNVKPVYLLKNTGSVYFI